MEIEYKEILTIELEHSYYASGKTNDFDFVFSSQSNALFKKGRLIPKISGNKLSVFAETRSGSLTTDLSEKSIAVALVLKNPKFYNFTKRLVSQGIAMIGNTGNLGVLSTAVPVQVVGGRFRHSVSKLNRNVSLDLIVAGTSVETHEIARNEKTDGFNYLLSSSDIQEFQIIENFSDEAIIHNYFNSKKFSQSAVDNLIKIKLDNSFLVSKPNYVVNFTAKTETLNYYIVGRNYGSTFNQLSVTGFDNQDPSTPTSIGFNKITASNFTGQHLSKEVLGIDIDSKVVLFQSVSPVPRRDKSKMDIQLSLQGDVLIPTLPLIGPERLTADFIVHLSKPKT